MAAPFGKRTPERLERSTGGVADTFLPGVASIAHPNLAAGETGAPRGRPLPPSGGASTCGGTGRSAPQAERPERRMHHPSADHGTARPAVRSFPAWTAYRGGVPGRAMCPPSSLMEPGAADAAPGGGGA